ncbi:MAG TPA: 50S ribosomal protein L18 [Gemmatimonadales bacterium]
MRLIHRPKTRVAKRRRRHLRIRQTLAGSAARPRLVVFRSLKHIYAQLVDDDARTTIVGVSDRSEGLAKEGAGKVGASLAVGKLLAEKAKGLGITKVVFDRAGYLYHGRVKAVAEAARKGGLEF